MQKSLWIWDRRRPPQDSRSALRLLDSGVRLFPIGHGVKAKDDRSEVVIRQGEKDGVRDYMARSAGQRISYLPVRKVVAAVEIKREGEGQSNLPPSLVAP